MTSVPGKAAIAFQSTRDDGLPGCSCPVTNAMAHRKRSMGERNFEAGSRRQRRRDTGDNLIRNARCPQRFGLFAATAEDERIASFQSDDALPLAGLLNELDVDMRPTIRMATRKFADANRLRSRSNIIEKPRRHEPIVENEIGQFEAFLPAKSQKARIAGTSADQIDDSRFQVSSSEFRVPSSEFRSQLLGTRNSRLQTKRFQVASE